MRYNDISPLENHHCAVAFQILARPECAIFANVQPEGFKQIRQVRGAVGRWGAVRQVNAAVRCVRQSDRCVGQSDRCVERGRAGRGVRLSGRRCAQPHETLLSSGRGAQRLPVTSPPAREAGGPASFPPPARPGSTPGRAARPRHVGVGPTGQRLVCTVGPDPSRPGFSPPHSPGVRLTEGRWPREHRQARCVHPHHPDR